jgi:hypothetical protein
MPWTRWLPYGRMRRQARIFERARELGGLDGGWMAMAIWKLECLAPSRMLGLAMLVALVGSGGGAAPKKAPHRFDYRKILPAGDERLPATERTRVALECLREEVARPTEPYFTPHDHHELLWTMVTFLTHESKEGGMDRPMIRAAHRAARNPEERDVLLLLLGNLGVKDARTEVTAYLRDVGNPPHLRKLAASALGRIRDPASIEVLLHVAETDRATHLHPRRSTVGHQSSMQRVYVVREAASRALVRFDQDLLLSDEAKVRLKGIRVAED